MGPLHTRRGQAEDHAKASWRIVYQSLQLRINVRGPTRRRMFDPKARRVYHVECSRVCRADLPDHVHKPSNTA